MLSTGVTDALILKVVKYDDSSVIVHAYTRVSGLRGYLARGVRKKGARIRIALLQPMNLVQIVAQENRRSQLFPIREISLAPMFTSIPFDIRKNTILMFMNEILCKVLKEETPNTQLFDFLKKTLVDLDTVNDNFSGMHLFFLAELTSYLGILPNFENKGWFDMLEGVSVYTKPLHEYSINHEERLLFETLFLVDSTGWQKIKFNSEQRNMLLDMLLTYYAIHIPGMEKIRSRTILHNVLH